MIHLFSMVTFQCPFQLQEGDLWIKSKHELPKSAYLFVKVLTVPEKNMTRLRYLAEPVVSA